MNNKRRLRRRKLKDEIYVSINGGLNTAATLVDLSEQGLLLLADEQIDAYTVSELIISLPDTIQGQSEIRVQGVSKWSKVDMETEKYLTGFELVIEEAKTETKLHLAMERYCEI